MITEWSRLKKKGSKHGRDNDSLGRVGETTYQSSRGNSSAWIWAGVWQKLNTVQLPGLCIEKRQMPCYSPAPHRGTVDTFDVHIMRIKSLSRIHLCSDGLSSNKTPFLLRTRVNNFSKDGENLPSLFSANDKWRSDQWFKSKSQYTGEKWPVLFYKSKLSFKISFQII